jgi:hypothetical protein
MVEAKSKAGKKIIKLKPKNNRTNLKMDDGGGW